MHNKQEFRNLLCRTISCATTATVVLAIVFVLTVVAIPAAQAQTFTVLHNFTGGQDGWDPMSGLTMDKGGNLYGTAVGGGTGGGGTVYELKHKRQGWVFNPLYSFAGGGGRAVSDGAGPYARVIFGPDGLLYGTTIAGGKEGYFCQHGCGTIFNLRPAPKACTTALCPGTETVLHRFDFGNGAYPYAELAFDQAGNIYGTTSSGGAFFRGVVYELTPSGMLGILHDFQGEGQDGEYPTAGVIFDSSGNLYGTTPEGLCGTIFELGGTYQVLYFFGCFGGGSGTEPYAGLIVDKSGNLYGATVGGGAGGGGTIFEYPGRMDPPLYSFTGGGEGPYASLIMDAYGNLYGTTVSAGAYGYGSVFELTPTPPTPWGPPPPNWTYITLHDFTGGSDGAYPYSNVIFDAKGHFYGTASAGGAYGGGVVWEITP